MFFSLMCNTQITVSSTDTTSPDLFVCVAVVNRACQLVSFFS